MRSLVLTTLVTACLAVSCIQQLNKVNFDLNPLSNGIEDYKSSLFSSDPNINRTIVYNICRNTVTIPKDMEGKDKCVETQHKVVGGIAQTTKEPSPVFLLSKIGNDESTCIRLALDATIDANSEITLFDKTDPAMGIILKYKEGDFCCPVSGTCTDRQYRQRTFSISLRCSDNIRNFPTMTSIETNNNYCDYKVYFRSIYACPIDCPRVNNNVCGQHGVCGYDGQNRLARCYCGDNYSGADCQKFEMKSLLSINFWAIVLTVILTLMVIATIFYVWNKLRKISVNPDAFQNLESKFNELGQMAY